MKNVHGIRGQTFPIWVFGTLTTLCLLAFAANYGNMLYWQIRAQNAADAAAQGAVSVQATHWNTLIASLHAAAIEEYRIRNILNDIEEVLGTPPGAGSIYQCQSPGAQVAGTQSCSTMYTNLVNNYLAAVNRYTADVNLVENADQPTEASDEAAIAAVVGQFSTHCGTATGGDCAFGYQVIPGSVGPRLGVLEDVHSDGEGGLVIGGGLNAPGNLSANLTPLQAEVVTCANVPPLFPQLSWLPVPTFKAIGRAAATTAMADQDFFQIGSIIDPITGAAFQPAEFPENANIKVPVGLPGDPNDNLYRIDYGGNSQNAYGNCGDLNTTTVGGLIQSQNPPCGTVGTTTTGGAANGGGGNGHGHGGGGGGGINAAPVGVTNASLEIFTGWWTSVAEASYAGPYTPPLCGSPTTR